MSEGIYVLLGTDNRSDHWVDQFHAGGLPL